MIIACCRQCSWVKSLLTLSRCQFKTFVLSLCFQLSPPSWSRCARFRFGVLCIYGFGHRVLFMEVFLTNGLLCEVNKRSRVARFSWECLNHHMSSNWSNHVWLCGRTWMVNLFRVSRVRAPKHVCIQGWRNVMSVLLPMIGAETSSVSWLGMVMAVLTDKAPVRCSVMVWNMC